MTHSKRVSGYAQGIQGNLDMLQQVQTESVRQLAQDVVAAVEDAESQLQVPICTWVSLLGCIGPCHVPSEQRPCA